MKNASVPGIQAGISKAHASHPAPTALPNRGAGLAAEGMNRNANDRVSARVGGNSDQNVTVWQPAAGIGFCSSIDPVWPSNSPLVNV